MGRTLPVFPGIIGGLKLGAEPSLLLPPLKNNKHVYMLDNRDKKEKM